ncbi:MAG: hypothetical protein IVW36_06900 [Dehalococcoidia bacterium]|nr:hypothetical protein [Dehalococcoidia bacterium]
MRLLPAGLRRLAPLAALLAVVAFAGIFSAAKCYPPNTRVVVFIQGLYSSYDASGTAPDGVEQHTFDTLKAALVARQYGATKLLDFSYAGGRRPTDARSPTGRRR